MVPSGRRAHVLDGRNTAKTSGHDALIDALIDASINPSTETSTDPSTASSDGTLKRTL